MLSVVLIWYFSLFFPSIHVMGNLIVVHVTDNGYICAPYHPVRQTYLFIRYIN